HAKVATLPCSLDGAYHAYSRVHAGLQTLDREHLLWNQTLFGNNLGASSAEYNGFGVLHESPTRRVSSRDDDCGLQVNTVTRAHFRGLHETPAKGTINAPGQSVNFISLLALN